MNRKSLIGLLACLTMCSPLWAEPAGALRVGAARVDSTPAEAAGTGTGKYSHEKLHIRAIVIDNGQSRAALIGADMIGLSDKIWTDASKQIAAELQCPVENVLMSATHSHSAFVGSMALMGARDGVPDPAVGFMLEAVRKAKAALRPAQVGFGTGQAFLNVNRDAIDPKTRLWYQGPNLEASSDKTVAVLQFTTRDGKPIAAYVNYAMHPVSLFLTGIVSADYPGAMSRYLEQRFDDKAVIVFTQGASGDQNPLYMAPTHRAMEVKRAAVMATGKAKDQNDVLALMMSGDPSGNVPLDPKAADELEAWVDAEGRVLGEEVLRIMTDTTKFNTSVRIWARQRSLTLPGRTRTNTGREGMTGTYVDGPDVNLRLGVLAIGDTALTSVNAELYTDIGQRLKKLSPMANTVVVTLANGMANSGYIPTDEAFTHNTFQVLGSRLKPGHAEAAIENGLSGMIDEYLKSGTVSR